MEIQKVKEQIVHKDSSKYKSMTNSDSCEFPKKTFIKNNNIKIGETNWNQKGNTFIGVSTIY